MQSSERHEYKNDFYEYINAGSLSSARVVAPLITEWLAPRSLLDVGCGAGAWCRVWREAGVTDVLGVDGDYVDRSALLIPVESFQSKDLSTRFSLDRSFDLVTSLEVAEHIQGDRAVTFVENLVSHGERILFSAAVPGQGGEFHVNEQPLDYWREHFARRGYRAFDPLRPLILGDARVEPWYRYNTLLYVAERAVPSLPAEVLRTEIAPGAPIAEFAPFSWRARNAVIRNLPGFAVNGLVKMKHEWGRRTRREPS